MFNIVISVLLLWLLFSALTAPLETLGWWAGWYTGEKGPASVATNRRNLWPNTMEVRNLPGTATPVAAPVAAPVVKPANAVVADSARPHLYVVYLTGIGGMEPNKHPQHEAHFLNILAERLPQATVVKDIFPYSATNEALTGDRIFSWFWRFMDRYKKGAGMSALLGYIPNLRNLFQVVVSADKRYGPVYNYACANLIVAGLLRHGYVRSEQTPIILLGYSGGAQMAAGALGYLRQMLGTPVTVISLAGIVCSTPGLKDVDHFYQLCSSKDVVEKIGPLIFPGRWPLAVNSTWNQLKRGGKLAIIHMGAVTHEKRGSYLDPDSYLAEGQSYLDHTVTTIVGLVNKSQVASKTSLHA